MTEQKVDNLTPEETTTEFDVDNEDCMTEIDVETEQESDEYNKLNGNNHSGILI